MGIRIRFALLLLLALVSGGCSMIVTEPRITLLDTRVAGLDTSGVDLEVHLSVSNPNRFDLSLLGYTYDLQVLSLPLSSGGKQETILFPAGSETALRIPVRLRYSDLLEVLKRSPDTEIPCQLDSTLNLATPVGRMSIPIRQKTSLKVPEEYRPSTYLNRIRDALQGIR